ncbi:MAG: DUF3352 domain-containing protein [Nocardioidaceae bacterium]
MSSNQPPQGPYGDQPPQGPYGQQPQGPHGTQSPQGGAYGQQSQPGQPGPPQGPPGDGWQQPDQSGGPPPGGGRKRGVVIVAVVAAIAVVAAGAVLAFQTFGGGGARPADSMPASALAYAQFDLDPSAEQKVNVVRLLRGFPEFEEETGITSDRDDLRQLAFEEALSDLDCDLDYEQDIEPWIGDRVGISAVPVDDTVIPVIAVQVSDEGPAEEAVSTLEECSTTGALPEDIDVAEEDSDVGVNFVGEYMLLTEADHLEAVVQMSTDSPLGDTDGFTQDMNSLEEQGVMSFWVDIQGLLETPEVASSMESSGEDLSVLEEYDSAFGALRAGSDYIELATMVRGGSFTLEADGDNPVTALPDTTLSALSVSGGGRALDENWDDLLTTLDSSNGGQTQAQIDAFESETGFSVPEDLVTLLGDNLMIALDAEGLSPDNLQDASDISNLGFGARFTTDPDAIGDLVDRIQSLIGEQGVPVELSTAETDDGLVLASNDAYADQLAEGGSLGDSQTFQTAVPDASEAAVVFYLDFDRLEETADEFGGADEVDRLQSLKAIGVSSAQDDDLTAVSFRMVFEDD